VIIDVIIPAYNEEHGVERVIRDIPKSFVRDILVCNNGSTDTTAMRAQKAGAVVLHAPKTGYGYACLAGINYLKSRPITLQPDIVVFLDADYSDFPEELPEVVNPIIYHNCDLVIGSRALGNAQDGAMTPQQIFGNWLATRLIRIMYRYHFTDLGPFRAVRWKTLLALDMQDKTYGWTVEMQVKAAKMKLKSTEVPVSYRKRIGKSKVSGTIRGSILAGCKILWTIFRLL